MSAFRIALIRMLDRPGGRSLLGNLATAYVRRATGRPAVGLRYEDGYWVHDLGEGVSVFDSTRFDFHTEGVLSWKELDAVVRETWLFEYDPQPGDTIMEVGSGTGFDLVVFAKAVGDGKVYGIEAHPRTFEMLQKTCDASGLHNATILQRAITDAAGTVEIEDHPHHTENRLVPEGASARGGWTSDAGSWDVQANTLDEVADELGIESLDYLKMNIEGAEALAIRSMSGILSRTKRVCIACHDFIGNEVDDDWYRTKAEVRAFLEGEGFRITIRDDDHRAPVRDQVWGTR